MSPQLEEHARDIADRGITHLERDNYSKALADFDRAIELNEKDAYAIAHRGVTYGLMDNYEAALADLDRAIELDEKEAWAIANRGETYRLMGNYEAALADFDRAINLYGKYPRVIWIIINRVFGMGRRYAYAIAHRGVTYRLMGNYEAALADFDRAIELDENDWYCYDRSIVYLAKSRLNAAEKDLQRAITLAKQKYQNEPGNWNNTLNLALYRLAAGQTADAERLYRESADAPAGFIREAILDLEYFLAVLPEHEQAIAMRNYLLSRVQKG